MREQKAQNQRVQAVEGKDPEDLARGGAAAGDGSGRLQQEPVQEAENRGLVPAYGNVKEDSAGATPTSGSTKDGAKGLNGLDSRGAAAGEDKGRPKSANNPEVSMPPADQSAAASLPPQESADEDGEAAYRKSSDDSDWFGRIFDRAKKSLGAESSQEAGSGSSTAKKVLVFGSSGTGKTSFVNALTGENMSIGDSANGVTFDSNEISVSHDGVDYRIVDTVGLNEADKGRMSSEAAVEALVRLLKRTEGGLNLMVMVVRKGRIHESTLDNYYLFMETMTATAVPLLIVVTHCEREGGDMQGWANANRQDFLSRGIKAKAFVGGTFLIPDPEIDNVEVMNGKIRQSTELSWDAVRACATDEPVDFMKMYGGFLGTTRRMYNSVVRHVGDLIQWAGNMDSKEARSSRVGVRN